MKPAITLALVLLPQPLQEAAISNGAFVRRPVVADEEEALAQLELCRMALRVGDAELIAVNLLLLTFDPHPKAADFAREMLRYRASVFDRKAVEREMEEAGESGRTLEKMRLARREAMVQARAVEVLVANAEKGTGKLLSKLLNKEKNWEDKPLYGAALLKGLGRLGHGGEDRLAAEIYFAYEDTALMQAALSYLRYVGTKRYTIVEQLCGELDAPAPDDPNSPSNPPAEYWEERWKKWQLVRAEVSQCLHSLTGQVFQYEAEGRPGEAERARTWLKENKKKLGLR